MPRGTGRPPRSTVEITRIDDGTLLVPAAAERAHDGEGDDPEAVEADTGRTTRLLHPGEGGYGEAVAEGASSSTPASPSPPTRPRRFIGEILAELD